MGSRREETNLQADGQVDPGAEGGADGTRGKADIFEELGEGLRESETRTLLRYHHTAPHARQVQTPSLEERTAGGYFTRLTLHERTLATVD